MWPRVGVRILPSLHCSKGGTVLVSHKNDHDEAGKITNFIKSQVKLHYRYHI